MTVITPEELLNIYPDGEFYRLTNEEELHKKILYKTGINTDILPFNPKGECEPGGMYFFHISQLHMYKKYCSDIEFIRKVSFTENSKIYVERDKFKTNEFVLGEREIFDEQKYIVDWINKSEERCKIVVQQNGISLRYIHNQTDELCRLAVQQDGYALQFVKNKTDELYKLAVQQDGNALRFIENQTDELCRLAAQKNCFALQFVENKTDELCRLASKQNKTAMEYIKYQNDENNKLYKLSLHAAILKNL